MNSSVELAQQYIAKSLNAKKRNKEFSLSLVTFANIKSQTHCAYSGIEFSDRNTMSLERIDNNVGYVDGNVIPVLAVLNSVRGDLEFSNIDSRIQFLENKLIEGRLKFENQNEEKMIHKRVFNVKLQKKYMNLYKVNKFLKNKIKKTEKLIDEISQKKKEKPHNKHYVMMFDDLILKLEKVTRQYTSNEKVLNQMYQNAPLRKGNVAKKHLIRESDLIRIEKLIKNLHLVKSGLAKYQNLSALDKQKLKHGLPLTTSRYKLLKQKMALNLINTQI